MLTSAATKIGLPFVPPYLQPGINFTNGVNFASAGAGVFPLANPEVVSDSPSLHFTGLVEIAERLCTFCASKSNHCLIFQISLRMQLSNFKNVAISMEEQIGDKEAKKLRSQAVYATCVGANDYTYFVDNYPNATQLEQDEFVNNMVGNLTDFVKVISIKFLFFFFFLSIKFLINSSVYRGDHFQFGLVFIKKKVTKLNFFLKTETEPKPVQTDRFWFGSVQFFRKKPVQTGLARFFWFYLVFPGLARFWIGFFQFGFGSVRFFWFQAYKIETEPNWSVFSKF
jgi:hypothetical protein